MGVPYTFATATTSIPLSQLDANFNTQVTIGTSTVGLGNTTTSLVGLSNVSTTALTVTNDASISGLTVGRGVNGSGTYNSAFGVGALAGSNTGNENTAIGYNTLNVNTSGATNLAVGDFALSANTTGSNNTSIGSVSLANNTTGGSNTAIGRQALQSNTTASNNTAVGYQAGYTNSTGGNLTTMGYKAGYSSTGNNNTFIGAFAGYNTTGQYNTFVGSLDSTNNYAAGIAVTSGSKNTILGNYSGNQGGLDIRTSSNYIVLSDGDGNPRGYFDNNGNFIMNGGGITGTSNATIKLPSSGGNGLIGQITSNSVLQVAYNSGSAGVSLASGATSWGTFSDSRLKNVTGTYTTALADIAQLQPVKFTWKSDEENKPQVGVIAQSVQSVVPEAVESSTIEKDGTEEYLTVRYTELIPLMIASIQELKAEFDAYKASHP